MNEGQKSCIHIRVGLITKYANSMVHFAGEPRRNNIVETQSTPPLLAIPYVRDIPVQTLHLVIIPWHHLN